ncbi:MAG: AMIN domain-containing protein, partial [Bacteroidota bacterium]|nr:AMIN domain-containing protein [Bacteroidota bacterium]
MKIILTVLFAFLSFISFSQKNSNNFFYVETKDSLPFLKYSLGEDRLGSAKMTFLDSEVILKVVDSFKTDYKVQLSQLHSAWIDKKNVLKIPFENLKQDLTDSWKVFGDSLFDYVTIQLPNKIPYKSMMQIDPSRIVIDIFGAVNNTNWITQLSTV